MDYATRFFLSRALSGGGPGYISNDIVINETVKIYGIVISHLIAALPTIATISSADDSIIYGVYAMKGNSIVLSIPFIADKGLRIHATNAVQGSSLVFASVQYNQAGS